MHRTDRGTGFSIFNDLTAFAKMVEETGLTFDLLSLTKLNTSFLQASEKNLILNIKSYEDEDQNNLLFLTDEKIFLYSKKPPTLEAFEAFSEVYDKPYGKSTILTFLTMHKVLLSYKERLENLMSGMKELELVFDAKKYRDLALEFERLYDRLEDFVDIVIRLEERNIKMVETRYISFDYNVLRAESNSLLDRCRNRLSMLKDIARDHEIQVTTELNRRIERLNDIVKKLTAITVILMIPTVIASHFGMNFAFMPELQVPLAYPAVIVAQIIIALIAVLVFRSIRWL